MRLLYPEIQPFETFYLDVDNLHSVYVEVSGNPDGMPVIFLHGGPCSGTKPEHQRFFNPDAFKIILFDQRGCGQSKPFGEIINNTTQELIADMELIRKRLGISQWLLFGGSWGAALALLYAQDHPDTVSGMIIRGVFLARQQDMEWFAGNGANRIYPEQWQKLDDAALNAAPNQRVAALWAGIEDADVARRLQVATAWQSWNGQVAVGKAYQDSGGEPADPEGMIKQVRMELHYALNDYFINDNQILNNCAKLGAIPVVIIHGRYDLVCPLEAGLSLHKALPQSDFIVLPNAGHISQHEEIIDALVRATDRFASL